MTNLSPPYVSPLPNQLRAWAGTYKSHGRNEEFHFLNRAAKVIEYGQLDAEIAAELCAFSLIAESKGQAGWSALLAAASDALTPPR